MTSSYISGRTMIALIILESKFKIFLSLGPEISPLGIYYKEIRNLHKYTPKISTAESFQRKEERENLVGTKQDYMRQLK